VNEGNHHVPISDNEEFIIDAGLFTTGPTL
jgi:hypothetical protein